MAYVTCSDFLLCCCVSLLLLACVGQTAEVCEREGGEECSKLTRQILEKTPTPCLEKYSEEHVEVSASAHISKLNGGHEAPHLLLLFGGSGAGKGTLIKHLRKHGVEIHNFAFHGLDEYLPYLPEFQKSVNHPEFVFKDAADACYSGGAIPIAVAAGKKIVASRHHAVYEETGKNLERVLKRVVPPFEGAGYRITLVLVDNDVEVAKDRAGQRFLKEGRYAPDDYIEGSFKNVPENYKKLRESGKVREAVYCDNSCKGEGSTGEPCLKCWRDVAEQPPGSAPEDDRLIPDAALEGGMPRYFNAAAR